MVFSNTTKAHNLLVQVGPDAGGAAIQQARSGDDAGAAKILEEAYYEKPRQETKSSGSHGIK